MTSTGWLKDLQGNDVYTDDNEWYFHADSQGWTYEPNLLAVPGGEPLESKIKREVQDLTHGWPSIRSALFPRKDEMLSVPLWRWNADLLRGWLAYIVVVQLILKGQILGVMQWAAFFLYSTVGRIFLALIGKDDHNTIPDWANSYGHYANNGMSAALFIFFVPMVGFPLAALYHLRVCDVDAKKGMVVAGGLTAIAVGRSVHQRNLKEQQMIADEAARKAARQWP